MIHVLKVWRAKDKAAGDLTIINWSTEERKKFRRLLLNLECCSKKPLAKEALLGSNLSYMRRLVAD